MIEHIIVQMEQERGLDRAAAIADMRFSFIESWWRRRWSSPTKAGSSCAPKHRPDPYRQVHRHPGLYRHHGLVFFLTFDVIGLVFQNLWRWASTP